jgi:hypothetical protein
MNECVAAVKGQQDALNEKSEEPKPEESGERVDQVFRLVKYVRVKPVRRDYTFVVLLILSLFLASTRLWYPMYLQMRQVTAIMSACLTVISMYNLYWYGVETVMPEEVEKQYSCDELPQVSMMEVTQCLNRGMFFLRNQKIGYSLKKKIQLSNQGADIRCPLQQGAALSKAPTNVVLARVYFGDHGEYRFVNEDLLNELFVQCTDRDPVSVVATINSRIRNPAQYNVASQMQRVINEHTADVLKTTLTEEHFLCVRARRLERNFAMVVGMAIFALSLQFVWELVCESPLVTSF